MKILELDDTLTPVKGYGNTTMKDVVRKFHSKDYVIKNDWKTRTSVVKEDLLHNTIPENADMYHCNYLQYLQECYAMHYGITIAPHTFWYSIIAEIAQYVVKNPESYRSLFTTSNDKIEIIVPGDYDQPLDMKAIHQKLIGLVPVDTTLFLPKFSTSTVMSESATLAAFLETTSPYYSYGMFACGYPNVRFDGTEEDWIQITSNLSELMLQFAKFEDASIVKYIQKVVRFVSDMFCAMNDNKVDFFKTIFTQRRCGSGSQYFIDGSYPNSMYIEIPKQLEVINFSTHITKVPYFVDGSFGRKNYKLVFALSHSYINDDIATPDFGSAVVKELDEPKTVSWD